MVQKLPAGQFNAALFESLSIMFTTMPWTSWSSLITISLMMGTVFPAVSLADSSKKHRGPCEIHYPSDARVEWTCRVIPPGKSLETIFGEDWADVARFNRIDRRQARPGLPIKVPRRIEDLKLFFPLPLFKQQKRTSNSF